MLAGSSPKAGFASGARWRIKMSFAVFVYVAANVFFMLFTLPAAIALFPFGRLRSRALSFCLRTLLHAMLVKAAPALGIYSLAPVAGAGILKRGGAVFVCNHYTLLDPLFMLALVPDAGVLLKRKYGKWLAVWYLIKIFDFIEVGGRSPAELASVVEKSSRLLSEKKNFIVFPEGSRSVSGRVAAFRSLAFKLAKRQNCDVVAVCISADSPFFSKSQKGLLPPAPTNFRIEIAGVLKPSDFRSADALCAVAHSLISSKAREIRAENSCAFGREEDNSGR